MRCLYCNEKLAFFTGRGYVHQGGSAYQMWCQACGWKGSPHPSPKVCPQCGDKGVRDDHCALPARS